MQATRKRRSVVQRQIQLVHSYKDIRINVSKWYAINWLIYGFSEVSNGASAKNLFPCFFKDLLIQNRSGTKLRRIHPNLVVIQEISLDESERITVTSAFNTAYPDCGQNLSV